MSAGSVDVRDPRAVSRARWRLGGLVVGLTFLGFGLLIAAALNARGLGDHVNDLGVLGGPAIAIVGALLIAAMVPASLVAAAAGYALGTVGGSVVALSCATGGAVLCAALGRHMGTPAARDAFGGRVARAVTWSDARPLRSVITARLLPGLPFNATSYALGLTGIGFREIAAGTAVGFAPRCFAYVALGGSVRDLSSPEARIAVGASVALALFVVVVPRVVVRAARHPNSSTKEQPYG